MIFDSSIGSGAVRQLLTFASAEALFEGVLLESLFAGEQPAIMPLAAMAAAPKLAPLRKFRRDIPSAACFIWFPFQWKYGGRFFALVAVQSKPHAASRPSPQCGKLPGLCLPVSVSSSFALESAEFLV